jgi:Protein of unknown function (DUF2934)
MLPTRDQIERAAYDRWIRRHRAHGHDRHDWLGAENELTYLLNYQTAAMCALDSSGESTAAGPIACRFCERTPSRATFTVPRPVVQGLAESTLSSVQICDECQEDCRDPLAMHCENFWKTVHAGDDGHQGARGREFDALAVFKSLVASALLIMPEAELAYFTDTLEWVNNPDHEYDGSLFADTFCHIYQLPSASERPWISLARRIDDEVPFPYMLSFLAWGGVVLQTALPMCLRDQDLDGRCERMPRRSLIAGEGPHFHEARSTVLRLRAGRRPRARAIG